MRILLLGLILALTLPAGAQERITLTAPETTPNNTAYRVGRLTITQDDGATSPDEGVLLIELVGIEIPARVACTYTASTTPTATSLITALNKANLSTAYAGNGTTGSLKQRIFHRLIVMNEQAQVCTRSLSGTLSGAPE